MDDELKKSLLAKRGEALSQMQKAEAAMKQAEADIYYLQGYIKMIDELIPQDALTLDQLKDLTGAQEVSIEPIKEGEK